MEHRTIACMRCAMSEDRQTAQRFALNSPGHVASGSIMPRLFLTLAYQSNGDSVAPTQLLVTLKHASSLEACPSFLQLC